MDPDWERSMTGPRRKALGIEGVHAGVFGKIEKPEDMMKEYSFVNKEGVWGGGGEVVRN